MFPECMITHPKPISFIPKGLCAVSQVAGSFVLVFPGLQKEHVRVEHYASKRTKFIMAHDSKIACFTLSQDGNLLATASSKGTWSEFSTLKMGVYYMRKWYIPGG